MNIELENNLSEVVPEFKLLVGTIDDKLRFESEKSTGYTQASKHNAF